ncbi:MAG: serpin family protein [Brevefilum sp.]|nr:serpin family protein [Brevefilum sp.]
MKKLILSLVFISLIVLAACQPGETIVDNGNGEKTVGFIKSELAREINPAVDEAQVQSLAQANTAFALEFFNQIRDTDGNIIFSPFSLSLALSMTLAGAETSTREGMLDALQMTLPENEVHGAFNALLLAIEASQELGQDEMEGDQFQLNIANSIWGQSDYSFKADFLDILAQHYGAGVYSVDYRQNPEGARNAINKWVAEETEEKIEDLIPAGAIDPLTRLVLANAIYFNGSWLHPFSQNATAQAPFYALDGSEISVEMMKLYGERFLYHQGQNYQALNLPYLSSDFVMTLLVPDADAYEDFEASLTLEDLSEILSGMSFERVDLEMPKFDFESSVDANDPLIALGMGDAFDPDRADFSGITEEEELMITDVLHKATITVDEEGTEAAAATAVIIGVTSAMPEEPISLVIDRPFMFMIRHLRTNTILFMGRVVQP